MPTGARRATARQRWPLETVALAALVFALLAACAAERRPQPIRPEQDLHHPDPRRRLAAARVVGTERQQERIGQLIELLDDDDATVRMVAAASLREITGRDTGYRAFDPPATRRAQVRAWRAWHAGAATEAAP